MLRYIISKRIQIFQIFHILLILITCFLSTYFVYCDYKKVSKDSKVANYIANNIANLYPIKIYTRWTGIEAGYGFFSPSVRSTGFIEIESCGVKIYPELTTIESQIRFKGLSSEISSHLFDNDKKNLSIEKLEEKKIKEDYFNLIYKNIAAKVINQSGCKTSIAKINYTLIDYPTLARLKRNNNQLSLIKLQEIEYETSK